MENGGDPPGTRRSANGRLINCKTGRFTTDPNKVKTIPSSRRASSRRSAASERTADRSRSVEEVSDNGQIQQQVEVDLPGVPSTTLPDSATFDVQAQLRKGDPIPVGQVQDQPPGNSIPPLLTFLSQGIEESARQQTPRDHSAYTNVDSNVISSSSAKAIGGTKASSTIVVWQNTS
eukprot:3272674-Amphidinium_carterae.1